MPSRILSALSLAALLLTAGCQTPLVDETGPLAIRSVVVTASPSIASQSDLRGPLKTAVSERLIGSEPEGKAANLSISIDDLSYKNAAMSLLVGSVNSMSSMVTVTDASGAPIATFPHKVILDAAMNGVIGAAIAMGQDKAEVDRRLVDAYANELRTRIYGQPGHRSKKQAGV